MKSFLRRSKASGSDKRKVENYFQRGARAIKRQLRSGDRRTLAERLAHDQ